MSGGKKGVTEVRTGGERKGERKKKDQEECKERSKGVRTEDRRG